MSSVNTTYFEETGEHVGTNTDWLGVRNALLSALTGQTSPFPAERPTKFAEGLGAGFVIGAGGATRAAIYALHTMNLSPIFILNRDEEETTELIRIFPNLDLVHLVRPGWRVKQATMNLRRAGKSLVAVVGAIPSIAPQTEEEKMVLQIARDLFRSPYEPSQAGQSDVLSLPDKPIFVDMVYRPQQTLLRLLAEANNWSSVCGVEVVLEGSFEQARLWTGSEVSAEIREEGRKLLRDVLEQEG